MPVHKGLVLEKRKAMLSPYVDLSTVRRLGCDVPNLLSANTRYQIRRAIRLYEGMGALNLERATTSAEGLVWLEKLIRLHQLRWTSKGKAGAFARPFFARFLRSLVEKGLERRVVDIVRVRAGEYELGYLCNFVYGDRVSNYQSGFQFEPDSRYKPGLVAHSLAVQHYAIAIPQLTKYSFLAGATQYKKSLSTGSEELWWYAYRPTSKLAGLTTKMIVAIATRLGS